MAGTFDFIWSLPVPRSAQVAASFAVNAALALPGTVLALLVGVWRYGVDLHLSPVLAAGRPALDLHVRRGRLRDGAAGDEPAGGEPDHERARVPGAPVHADRVPGVEPARRGYMRIHEVLPFYPMAQVIRAGLTEGVVTDVGGPFLVIGVWAAARDRPDRLGGRSPPLTVRPRPLPPDPQPATRGSR